MKLHNAGKKYKPTFITLSFVLGFDAIALWYDRAGVYYLNGPSDLVQTSIATGRMGGRPRIDFSLSARHSEKPYWGFAA
jgi:hypothetical protein